jgi:hypothetical protein
LGREKGRTKAALFRCWKVSSVGKVQRIIYVYLARRGVLTRRDAAWSVVEDDIDRRTILDRLKAVLRKHSDQRVISFLTMNDIAERACSARSPTHNATTVT